MLLNLIVIAVAFVVLIAVLSLVISFVLRDSPGRYSRPPVSAPPYQPTRRPASPQGSGQERDRPRPSDDFDPYGYGYGFNNPMSPMSPFYTDPGPSDVPPSYPAVVDSPPVDHSPPVAEFDSNTFNSDF